MPRLEQVPGRHAGRWRPVRRPLSQRRAVHVRWVRGQFHRAVRVPVTSASHIATYQILPLAVHPCPPRARTLAPTAPTSTVDRALHFSASRVLHTTPCRLRPRLQRRAGPQPLLPALLPVRQRSGQLQFAPRSARVRQRGSRRVRLP